MQCSALLIVVAGMLSCVAAQQGWMPGGGQGGGQGGQGVRQEWGWPGGQQQQQQATQAPVVDGVLTVLPASCQCSAPEQYNPVCGSDGNTYQNRQKLNCFAACGSSVTFVRLGVCKRRQDVPT